MSGWWPLLFALEKKTTTDPLLLSGTFTSNASNAHVPSHPSSIFLSTKLQIKLSAFPYLVSFIYVSFFFRRSLQGNGMLFTLISCYLWAQLRLMLQVIALLLHSTALDEGERWSGKKTVKKSETQSHLRVKMITLTRSGGPMQSSVKLGHETEWWHTDVFCPHSIHIHTFYSCCWSGAIGSGHQMSNMLSVPLGAWWQRHARHKQTLRQKIHPAVGTLLP